MPGGAATAFHPKLARPQIDLVVDYDDFRRRNLEEPRRLGDRFPGSVHKGLRLQQQPSLAADHALRKLTLEPAPKPRHAVTPGDHVDCREADIVSVPGITRARITKADNETHHRPIEDAAKPRPENSGGGRLLGH